jgi:hypothetical protein
MLDMIFGQLYLFLTYKFSIYVFNLNVTFMIQIQKENICYRLDLFFWQKTFFFKKQIIHDAQNRSQHENGQFLVS